MTPPRLLPTFQQRGGPRDHSSFITVVPLSLQSEITLEFTSQDLYLFIYTIYLLNEWSLVDVEARRARTRRPRPPSTRQGVLRVCYTEYTNRTDHRLDAGAPTGFKLS